MSLTKRCWMCGGDGKIGDPKHPCGNCRGTGRVGITEEEAKRLILEDEIYKRKL